LQQRQNRTIQTATKNAQRKPESKRHNIIVIVIFNPTRHF